MARWFIHVEIGTAPRVPNVPSPSVHGKSGPEAESKSGDSVPYQSPVQSSLASGLLSACFQLQPLSGSLRECVSGVAWPWATRLTGPRSHGERTHERREQIRVTRVSLFPWDYISLGLGWTRCLFKMTNQFLQYPRALDGFTTAS